MFAASKTAAAASGAAPTDPNFNYVTMLLHGDGTNGAQNNTFLDSSTNNFTITRNGTPTQGSYSPYGDLWSNQFSGSGNYSTISSPPTTIREWWTTDFTIETWIYPTTIPTSTYPSVCGNANAINTTNYWSFGPVTGNVVTFFYFSGGERRVTSTQTVTLNQWNHIAMTKTSSGIIIWVNGVGMTAVAVVGTPQAVSSEPFIIGQVSGRNTVGYVSNLRIVKGTAVYTANFTPPTAPLTAITNTSLLTCQSNRFRDNSSNNFTLTATGTPSVQRFSPFDPAAAYSTSVIGGSGIFNGSSDYLTLADNAAWDLPGDFTVECFVYLNGSQNDKTFLTQYSSTSGGLSLALFTSGNRLSFGAALIAYDVISTGGVPLNQWAHVAAVRSGSSLKLYINGVNDGTATQTRTYGSADPLGIGGTSGSSVQRLNGYLSNARIVKGTAVYTANFTPPTAPLTAITNTVLLTNFTNAGIFDNAMMNNLVTVGNAQVSTAVTKFGTGSMAFDGTGDWLTFIDTPNVQLGTGNFTIEGWVYLSALGSVRGFFSKGTSTTGISLGVNASNQLVFNYTASSLTATTALVISTWYHVAVVRNGTATGNVKIYLNGTADATSGGAINDNFNQTSIGYIGADRVATSPMNGYIDDLRVTKGLARYTANFTAPTAAFPDN
jgi:hypothetical protein